MRKFAVLLTVFALLVMPAAGASTRLVATPSCEEPVPSRHYDAEGMSYGMEMDLAGCWWYDGGPIQLEATLSRLDGTGEEGSTSVVLCGGRVLGEERSSRHDRAGDGEEAIDEDAGEEDDARDDTHDTDKADETDEADDEDARNEDAGDEEEDASSEDGAGEPEAGDDKVDEGSGNGGGRSRVAAAGDVEQTTRSSCEVVTVLEHSPAEVARYSGEIKYPWKNGPRTVGFTAYCSSPVKVCHEG
jgi:hypothetical protein